MDAIGMRRAFRGVHSPRENVARLRWHPRGTPRPRLGWLLRRPQRLSPLSLAPSPILSLPLFSRAPSKEPHTPATNPSRTQAARASGTRRTAAATASTPSTAAAPSPRSGRASARTTPVIIPLPASPTPTHPPTHPPTRSPPGWCDPFHASLNAPMRAPVGAHPPPPATLPRSAAGAVWRVVAAVGRVQAAELPATGACPDRGDPELVGPHRRRRCGVSAPLPPWLRAASAASPGLKWRGVRQIDLASSATLPHACPPWRLAVELGRRMFSLATPARPLTRIAGGMALWWPPQASTRCRRAPWRSATSSRTGAPPRSSRRRCSMVKVQPWWRHGGPPAAHQAASEGLGLPSARVRRRPASQVPQSCRGTGARPRPRRHSHCVCPSIQAVLDRTRREVLRAMHTHRLVSSPLVLTLTLTLTR